MNTNLILFIILTILTIIALYYEYIHIIDEGIYHNLAKIDNDYTPEQIQEKNDMGFWDLEHPVIWRRTIIGTFLFFVISYLVIWSLQISFNNSIITNVENYPWVVLVLVVFIIFYLIQSFFIYHHLCIITKEIKKNIKELIKT